MTGRDREQRKNSSGQQYTSWSCPEHPYDHYTMIIYYHFMHWIMYSMHAVASIIFASLWPNELLPHQPPSFVGFTRQEYWSGLPFPSARDLPDPGIEPMSLTSLALAGGFLTTSATWEAHIIHYIPLNCIIPIIYLLQTECLGPQIHMLKSNTQCNDFWRWGLHGVMRS